MDINLTLIGQMITFALFVWFVMKFVWPPVIKAMQDRQKKIAEGLDAAERGQQELERSKKKSVEILKQAKGDAERLLDNATSQADQTVQDAKARSAQEGLRIIADAHSEIEHEAEKAKAVLQKDLAEMIVSTTGKVLKKQMNPEIQAQLVDEFIGEI